LNIKCIPDLQEQGTILVSIIENMTEIAKETGLEDVEVGG
jgi:hypothetical protein